jgi:hypothetical protein
MERGMRNVLVRVLLFSGLTALTSAYLAIPFLTLQ